MSELEKWLSLWENELHIVFWVEIQLQDIDHPAHSSDTTQMQTSFFGTLAVF